MPKNVMKLLKRSANHSRNAFDLSHRHLLSANFGELLPVTCIETVPGDYIELRISDLLRALPMVTSPFMRVKQHFDVWFTPYEDLWSNFESFMVQKYEPKHGNNLGGFTFCPHVNLHTLQSVANQSAWTDIVGRPFSTGATKLLDLLGYGRNDISGTASDHPEVNLWRLAQYNKIWYEEYRQQYYDDGLRMIDDDASWQYQKNASVLFNFDDLPCTTLANSNVDSDDSVVLETSASTARLRAMLQMRYRCWKKDLYTGLMPSTQFGNVSMVSVKNFNAIDSFSLGTIDNTYSGHLGVNQAQGDTDVRLNTNAVSGGWQKVGLQAKPYYDSTYDHYTLMALRHGNEVTVEGQDLAYPKVNILDLRKSEAIQIWREAALTAGNRVSDNLRAHYGDDVDYNDHRSTFLGSVDAPLNISDVNATAETGSETNGVLGDVAGKGISSLDEKVIKFKSKKFGCIMVMFSLLPEAEYESLGIDRMNQLLESEDYFVNEYQDLGLEAVSSQTFYHVPTAAAKVIGYAPRYWAYKQKIDKVFGQFRGNGIYAPWASAKTDVSQALASIDGALPLQTLYVNPALFNHNFGVDVSNSDQMLCDIYFDCSAVRPMSITGLPKF